MVPDRVGGSDPIVWEWLAVALRKRESRWAKVGRYSAAKGPPGRSRPAGVSAPWANCFELDGPDDSGRQSMGDVIVVFGLQEGSGSEVAALKAAKAAPR
jgi:hypothetical protein